MRMTSPAGAGRRRRRLLLAAAGVGLVLGVALQRSGVEAVPGFAAPEPRGPRFEAPGKTPEGPPGTPAPRAALAGLPPYPGARPQGFGAGLEAQGTPLALAWFETDDPPDAVLGFYAKALAEADLDPVTDRFGTGAGYVGYHDPRSGEMHVVTVVPQDGRTLVFPSAGRPQDMVGGEAAVPDDLPRHPDAVDEVVLGFGASQVSVAARVHQGLDDVVRFYRAALRDKGWRLDDDRAVGRDARVFAADADGRRLSLTLRRDLEAPGGAAVEVLAVLTSEG